MAGTLGVVALVVGGVAFWWNSPGSAGLKHAAIIDQLSATAPNPGVLATTTGTLEKADTP